MRNENYHHIETDDLREAMEKRIETIKQFQEAMPPKKAEFSDETIKKWDELLKSFDDKLEEAQKELLEMQKIIYNSSKD